MTRAVCWGPAGQRWILHHADHGWHIVLVGPSEVDAKDAVGFQVVVDVAVEKQGFQRPGHLGPHGVLRVIVGKPLQGLALVLDRWT